MARLNRPLVFRLIFVFEIYTAEVQTGQPNSSTNPQGSTGVSGRVSFDVTRLNFRGRDHTITLKTRYGNLEKLALPSTCLFRTNICIPGSLAGITTE